MLALMADLANPMVIARLQPQEQAAILPAELGYPGDLSVHAEDLRIPRATPESELCPQNSASNRAYESELEKSIALQAGWECATANNNRSLFRIAADKFREMFQRRNWVGTNGVFLRGDKLCIERDGKEDCPGERKSE